MNTDNVGVKTGGDGGCTFGTSDAAGVVLKPHAQKHLLSPVDKCKVCREPAAKHIHYGAMSCFSCRAFFRRSIQNGTAKTYVCRRSKDCEINLKTRKNCQYCRYERCLSVGMKPSWVLSPQERELRFKKKSQKGKMVKQNDPEEHKHAVQPPPIVVKSEVVKKPASPPRIEEKPVMVTQEGPPLVVKRESPPPLVNTTSQWVGDPSSSSSPTVNPTFTRRFEVPSAASSMVLGKDVLLISPVQHHQNFYICSSSASQQHFPSAKPVISSRDREGVSSIIIQPAAAVPFNNVQLSNTTATTPSSRSPGVIVKSHQAAERRRISQDSGRSSYNQRFSPSPPKKISEIASGNWYIPITSDSAVQLHRDASSASSASPKYTSSAADDFKILHQGSQQNSAYLQADCHRRISPINEESEYEDSVYSRSSYSDDERSVQGFLCEPEIKFTEGEHQQLRELVCAHDERYKSVSFGEELIKEMIMCSMFGIPISASAAISGYRLTIERMRRVANNLDCFRDLSLCDQSSLLKENADLLVSLRGAIFFDSKKKGVNQLLISLGIDDMQTIKTMFTPLMKESSMKHIDYKIFNSIQKVESNNSIEHRYNFLQAKVMESITDDVITILLTYIILFSVDFCTLQEQRRVEQLQEQFIKMLERYVYSKMVRKEACNALANILNAVTCIREMADIKKSRAINQAVKLN